MIKQLQLGDHFCNPLFNGLCLRNMLFLLLWQLPALGIYPHILLLPEIISETAAKESVTLTEV